MQLLIIIIIIIIILLSLLLLLFSTGYDHCMFCIKMPTSNKITYINITI